MNEFKDASKCFAENLRLFVDAKTDPEKYNLYQGLRLLAEGLEKLDRGERDIKDQLRVILSRVN